MSRKEKLLIVQMVSKGAVSPEQGAELLQALGRAKPEVSGPARPSEASHEQNDPGSALSSNIESSVSGLGKAIARMFGGSFRPGGPEREFHKEFTGEIPAGGVLEVGLFTINGRIEVRAWDQPGFRLDVRKKVWANSDAEAEDMLEDAFTFTHDGNTLEARTKATSNFGWHSISVGFNLSIPRNKVSSLRLDSSNGRITVDGVSGVELRASTSNGRILVQGSDFEECVIATANGRVEYRGKAKALRASTANGRIVADLEGAGDWRLDSANGRIEVNIVKAGGVGYEVDVSTQMGRISVTGLEDVLLEGSKQKVGAGRYKARSRGFMDAASKATLKASTTTGRIAVSM